MARQGRCSAGQTVVLGTTLLVFLLLHFETTRAAKFTVGDTSGWTFNVNSWTNGKKFTAGDILVFNYDPTFHNLVIVDVNGYNNCVASSSSKTYTSGNDQIKLSEGT
ncbi:hypothetical protein L1049_004022 [Liquidambar formosana]|uniref:Phytocyanin domain-containing protein n=1 Tax=Liquidambar formosana TaxID=63359 RepID=A0AAP0RMS0_LIQFO